MEAIILKKTVFDQINEHVSDMLKNNPLQDWEKNIKTIIISIFKKLDLVTREEFEIQQKVLSNTRKKLEELEQKLEQKTKN